jgi:hypothetical protein
MITLQRDYYLGEKLFFSWRTIQMQSTNSFDGSNIDTWKVYIEKPGADWQWGNCNGAIATKLFVLRMQGFSFLKIRGILKIQWNWVFCKDFNSFWRHSFLNWCEVFQVIWGILNDFDFWGFWKTFSQKWRLFIIIAGLL